jgi:hypothetical protein
MLTRLSILLAVLSLAACATRTTSPANEQATSRQATATPTPAECKDAALKSRLDLCNPEANAPAAER